MEHACINGDPKIPIASGNFDMGESEISGHLTAK